MHVHVARFHLSAQHEKLYLKYLEQLSLGRPECIWGTTN